MEPNPPQSEKKYPRNAVFLAALLWISIAAAQQPPSVVFLAPNQPGEQPFWTQAIEIMQAVAEDLKINLEILYSRPSSYSQKKDGLKALNTNPVPDYFLTLYMIEATPHHLKLAEKLGIRTFIFNAGVTAEDRGEIGRPREKYRHWIGQMVPDDRQAGYLLADKLINQAKAAKKTDDSGKVHLISIGGFGASIDKSREDGLKARIDERKDGLLEKAALTGWSQSVAYEETIRALQEFPEVSVIWCVSDATALGAIEAAKKSGRIPGRDIFIGGIDWSPAGLEAIVSGDMAVSVGGHFLEGAKALILIHDYHYGIDFADMTGVEMVTSMSAIDHDNAPDLLEKLEKIDWPKVNFKRFSRKYNPGLESYGFSLQSLLRVPNEATNAKPGQ